MSFVLMDDECRVACHLHHSMTNALGRLCTVTHRYGVRFWNNCFQSDYAGKTADQAPFSEENVPCNENTANGITVPWFGRLGPGKMRLRLALGIRRVSSVIT